MPEISVISPVYKVEAFIGKMIDSVLAQSFKDFEFILIDDGSPDRSGEIIDEYARKDARIIPIHQKNAGASATRNVGIERAAGKYIYFIDADDWIESQMLGNMYKLAEQNEADLVVTGFCVEYCLDGRTVTFRNGIDDAVYTRDAFRRAAYKYLNNSVLGVPWNKLYNGDFLRNKGLKFPDMKWEDYHFSMEVLMDVNRVVMSSDAMYHWYRSRQESKTMVGYSDPDMYRMRLEHYEHILRVYEHWGLADDPPSRAALGAYYGGRLVQCAQEIAANGNLSRREKRAKVDEILSAKTTQEAVRYAKPDSWKLTVLLVPLRMNSVRLALLMGSALNLVRKAFPNYFIHLKEREVHSA